MKFAGMVAQAVVVFVAAAAYPFIAQHVHDGHEKRVEMWLAAIFIATMWRK